MALTLARATWRVSSNHLRVEATETSHLIIQPHLTFLLYHSTYNSSANLQNRKFHKSLTSEKLQNSPTTVNYQQNIPITQASNSNNPPLKRGGKKEFSTPRWSTGSKNSPTNPKISTLMRKTRGEIGMGSGSSPLWKTKEKAKTCDKKRILIRKNRTEDERV